MRSKTFLRAAAIAVMAIGVSSLALAVAGPVEDRQAAMKDIGASMKDAVGLNSPATFDAAKAKATMGKIADDAKKAAGLFPKGSDADPKTLADPKIWTDNADFLKRLSELQTLAAAAGASADAAAYKTAFGELNKSCKSCHDVYRKKKAAG
jgi:cytochrome c556